jgi:hypothetical protein
LLLLFVFFSCSCLLCFVCFSIACWIAGLCMVVQPMPTDRHTHTDTHIVLVKRDYGPRSPSSPRFATITAVYLSYLTCSLSKGFFIQNFIPILS